MISFLSTRPSRSISVNAAETTVQGRPITDSSRVDGVVRKFKSKYGEGDVKIYAAPKLSCGNDTWQAYLSILHLQPADIKTNSSMPFIVVLSSTLGLPVSVGRTWK
jgi:hypothetical protein